MNIETTMPDGSRWQLDINAAALIVVKAEIAEGLDPEGFSEQQLAAEEKQRWIDDPRELGATFEGTKWADWPWLQVEGPSLDRYAKWWEKSAERGFRLVQAS